MVRDGCLYFSVYQKSLLGNFWGYRTDGRGFFQGMGVETRRKALRDLFPLLASEGAPTIVSSDIPLDWIPDEKIREFPVEVILHVRSDEEPRLRVLGFSICLMRSVPPDLLKVTGLVP